MRGPALLPVRAATLRGMGRYATARGWIQLDPDQRGAAEAIGLMLISPEEQDAYWWEIRDGLVLRRTAPATAWIDE